MIQMAKVTNCDLKARTAGRCIGGADDSGVTPKGPDPMRRLLSDIPVAPSGSGPRRGGWRTTGGGRAAGGVAVTPPKVSGTFFIEGPSCLQREGIRSGYYTLHAAPMTDLGPRAPVAAVRDKGGRYLFRKR